MSADSHVVEMKPVEDAMGEWGDEQGGNTDECESGKQGVTTGEDFCRRGLEGVDGSHAAQYHRRRN